MCIAERLSIAIASDISLSPPPFANLLMYLQYYTAWQKKRPLELIPATFDNIVAEHTGQSSQHFLVATDRIAWSLPAVAGRVLIY
jgi:hypothetical protein